MSYGVIRPPDSPGPVKTSTGRVLWTIWCLVWAAVWLVAGIADFPHHGCVMTELFSASGNNCMAYGTVGSPVAFVFLLFAAGSAAAIGLPVGRE